MSTEGLVAVEARCPSCGATIRFDAANSIVAVCGSCSSVVGRGGDALENLGKVAELVQTDSPLKLGLRGRLRGKPFEIRGRVQYRHAAGGVWDEWYASFDRQDEWGWIAEAQGRVYLTFPHDVNADNLPNLETLDLGHEVRLPGVGILQVDEVGTAEVIHAQGELPILIQPGHSHPYADLSGKGNRFATISVGEDGTQVFVGKQLTYARLGLADAASAAIDARKTEAVSVPCPKCGGPLELRVPDETLRIGCPYCGSLLDANDGKLEFFKAYEKTREPLIPLGSVGKFPIDLLGAEIVGDWELPEAETEIEFTVIGYLRRQVKWQRQVFAWDEYLLYRPRTGFCWLIHNENHWNFGRPVPAADVNHGFYRSSYKGRRFRIYDKGKPEVVTVLGECYWRVEIGETVAASDYISPPFMLSREVGSVAAKGDADQKPTNKSDRRKYKTKFRSKEVNYTLARYLETADVESAFGMSGLSQPDSVFPNQPYPNTSIYKAFLGLLAAAVLVAMIVFASGGNKTVFTKSFPNAGTPLPAHVISQPIGGVKFTEQIELSGMKHIRVSVTGTSWVYVHGELFDEEKKRIVRTFALPRGEDVYVSSVRKGKYTLSLTADWDRKRNRTLPRFTVNLEQGSARIGPLITLLLLISALPLVVWVHHTWFSMQRWKNSDYSPYATSED